MSVGESSVEEQIERHLRRIEDVRKHYSKRFAGLDGPEGINDFIFQLFADATYLALHEGISFEAIQDDAANHVLLRFPSPE